MEPQKGAEDTAHDPTAVRDEDTFTPTTSMRPPPMPDPDADSPWARKSLASMRRSLFSIPPLKPRWQPWSPARVVRTALAFAALMALLVAIARPARPSFRWSNALSTQAHAPVDEPDEPVVTPSVAAPPRADAALSRAHRSPVAGGLLSIPPSFQSKDGAYDLVIHFHGNTDLVEESLTTSGLNAVFVIMNLGNGSGRYEERFANPASLPEVLDRTQSTLEKRGLAHARLRRLALTAWSAGYGAVIEVLAQPALAEKVDSVILLDGIHVGYKPKSTELLVERLAPFERFAREAAAGKKLFSITHTNITPVGSYAGTHETTDALLKALGIPRREGGDTPAMPSLRSIDGVIARKKQVGLVPESTADRGGLHVRGYRGDQPDDHMAHLIHMTTTALPDLVAHWREVPAAR